MTIQSLTSICGAILVLLYTSVASAQYGPDPNAAEFALGVGYANISLGQHSGLNSEGGVRFEPSLSLAPLKILPQLRLGAAIGTTLVLDNSDRTLIVNNGQVIFHGSSDIPLWTLEPELRLSWRQTFNSNSPQAFFIEPGVAGGEMFGFFHLQSTDPADTESYSANDSTAYGRVFLRAGVPMAPGWVAIEGSYLTGGKLDFGQDIKGSVSEFYIGICGAIQF
jgi:hypothetical protein